MVEHEPGFPAAKCCLYQTRHNFNRRRVCRDIQPFGRGVPAEVYRPRHHLAAARHRILRSRLLPHCVSPSNENFLIGGGFDLHRSVDGGVTWSDFSHGKTVYTHVDQHAAAFSSDGNTLYIGNDGGVWRTTNPENASFDWTPLNSTLAITQTYSVSVHPSDSSIIFVGTQDTGTLRFTGNPSGSMLLAAIVFHVRWISATSRTCTQRVMDWPS